AHRSDPADLPPPSLVPLPVRLQSLDEQPRSTSQLAAEAPMVSTAEPPPVIVRRSATSAVSVAAASVAAAGPTQTVHRVSSEQDVEQIASRESSGEADIHDDPTRVAAVADGQSLQRLDTKAVIALLASKQAATHDRAVE